MLLQGASSWAHDLPHGMTLLRPEAARTLRPSSQLNAQLKSLKFSKPMGPQVGWKVKGSFRGRAKVPCHGLSWGVLWKLALWCGVHPNPHGGSSGQSRPKRRLSAAAGSVLFLLQLHCLGPRAPAPPSGPCTGPNTQHSARQASMGYPEVITKAAAAAYLNGVVHLQVLQRWVQGGHGCSLTPCRAHSVRRGEG